MILSHARPPLAGLEPTLRAVAETVVPCSRGLADEQWAEVQRIVEGTLEGRPPRMIRQLRLFIRALDILAVLTSGHSFRALGRARRERLLARLQDAPLLVLRRGTWGLRTLVLAGYYGRPAAAREIGYAASLARKIVQ